MKDDLYAVLGILPDAEDIVITAAYRALAQRYHPDKWKGDPAEANSRMRKLNNAYEILGNKVAREKYDRSRPTGEKGDFAQGESEETNNAFRGVLAEAEERWSVAVELFEDLPEIRFNLEKMSTALAFSYVMELLESKKFSKRKEIAKHIENAYLQRYFGNDKEVLRFARELITTNQRAAARKLNKYISIVGPEIEPSVLIRKISDEFQSPTEEYNFASKTELMVWVELFRATPCFNHAERVCTFSNYVVEVPWYGYLLDSWANIRGPKGDRHCFANQRDFIVWVAKNLAQPIR